MRYDCSISVCSSMGSTEPNSNGGCCSLICGRSYIEEPHVFGVGLDELLPELDVLAHEDGADLVGQGGLLDGDLEQGALVRVHGGVAQLGVVHLAQALEAGELVLLAWVLGDEAVA